MPWESPILQLMHLGYSVIKIRLLAILFGGSNVCTVRWIYVNLLCTYVARKHDCWKRVGLLLLWLFLLHGNPSRILIGAYIFGGVSIMQMNLQAFGLSIPGQFFNMAPYLATMLVLVLISSNKLRIKLSAPASLTKAIF